MARKNSFITVTDQFCGAGGSSEGVKQASISKNLKNGLQVRMALNHWKLAIETHNTNHPDTDHDCTDISACDPRKYPSTNILITSPECTNHSLAKGKKRNNRNQAEIWKNGFDAAEERSRATMWDVPRFAEYHNYELIIVENVVDARYWVMFDAWLMAMQSLGYQHECVYLNSMHAHPTPQSRDRMYVVFWKKGNKKPDLAIRPRGWCGHCAKETETYQSWKNTAKKWGKYKMQYLFRCPSCNNVVEPYYHAAFNCIDWSIPGTRIGDRKKVLSENTMKRIKYGIDKYWNEPSYINIRFSSGIECRVKGTTKHALPSQTGDNNIAILNPLLVRTEFDKNARGGCRSVTDPLKTQSTAAGLALFNPLTMTTDYSKETKVRDVVRDPAFTQTGRATGAVVLPFIIKNYGGPPQRPFGLDEALGSVTTQDHHGLVNPLIIENKGQSNARPINKALGCVTTVPSNGILSPEALNSFLTYYYGGSDISRAQASHITEAVRTISGNDRAGLISVKPKIEDCYYRMLLPHEVKLGMAFGESYIVLGNSKEQVKQLGNAVTPPAMKFLIERCIETLI